MDRKLPDSLEEYRPANKEGLWVILVVALAATLVTFVTVNLSKADAHRARAAKTETGLQRQIENLKTKVDDSQLNLSAALRQAEQQEAQAWNEGAEVGARYALYFGSFADTLLRIVDDSTWTKDMRRLKARCGSSRGGSRCRDLLIEICFRTVDDISTTFEVPTSDSHLFECLDEIGADDIIADMLAAGG